MKSGIKRSELHRSESSVLEKKTISGSTEQAHVDHVRKFIMTGAKNMAAESRIALWDVTVTGL